MELAVQTDMNSLVSFNLLLCLPFVVLPLECLIETLAWGWDDTNNDNWNSIGDIRLNGNVLLVTGAAERGYVIIELDVNIYSASSRRHFDINANTTYAYQLAAYVQNLHPPTVLVGVSKLKQPKTALLGVGGQCECPGFSR
jgi:hypothetical protein